MTQGANTSTLALTDCGKPAADQACLRSTQLYKGRVPEFAQALWLALQRRPDSLDGDPLQPRSSRDIYTYAVLEDGRPLVVFFFQLTRNKARVLNQAAQASGAELQQFSRYLFQHFPSVRRISFFSQQRYIQIQGKKRLHKNAERLLLPPELTVRMEEALRFSRHNVKYFLQRLKQDHPDFKIEVHANTADTALQCRALLQLNRPQLAHKSAAQMPLDEAGENLVRAAQEAGWVCVLKIGGRIAAGAICLRSGRDSQLHFLAQDPRLQAYGLGMLCCYFTACEHIDRQRGKAGATIIRPRAVHALRVRQECMPVLSLHRPHASWLVRCDHALYTVAIHHWRRTMQLRDDCLQLGQALVRLVAAWRLGYQMMKKRLASLWRLPALPAFLRSH